MIPKYLKIKGLYSYQTEQEIHFDALTDASLFGIFGAVGSGKSSILEAITFALYGDTERLNKSGDDRTYNMMNLRSDELLIDFECIAGKDAEHYRFTVRGRRNSKNFRDVKTFERKAYVHEEGTWVPLSESVNAESIIGLSYDNFRRTIIIPQGRFQEFIELRDSDRTRMMKELFQLEKYDLSRKVGSLTKQNDLSLSGLDGQLIGLGEVTPEMVEAEENRRNAIRTEIGEVNAALLLLAEQEKVFQDQKAADEKIRLLRNQLHILDGQRPGMQAREEALRLFEICSLHFKSLLDQKKHLNAAVLRDEKVYFSQQTRIRELTVGADRERAVIQELKPRYDTREELLDTIAELGKVIQIIDNNAWISQKKQRLASGEHQLAEKEKGIEAIRIQKLDQEGANETRKAALIDIQEITAIKSWFAQADLLVEARQAIKKEAEDLQAEIGTQQALLDAKLSEISTRLAINLPQQPVLTVFQSAMQGYAIQNEERRKALRQELVKASTRLALQQYAVSLQEGEPCPLCGAEHHPAVLHTDESVTKELTGIESQLARFDELDDHARKMQTPVERLFNQIENLEKQKASIKERWTEARLRIEQHDLGFIWQKFDKTDRSGFEQHFQQVTRDQALIRETEAQIRRLNARLESEILEKTEKFEKPLQVLRDEILRLDSTTALLSAQLEKVDLDEIATQPQAEIREKMQLLHQSYGEITRLYEETRQLVDVMEKERDMLAGSQATLEVALEGSRNELKEVQHQMDLQLVKYGFAGEDQVAVILQHPIRIDEERTALDTFRFACETTERDLNRLVQENAGQDYDADQHIALIQSKRDFEEKLNALRKEEGGLDRLLKKMAEDLARKASLLEEKGKLQLRKEHLDELTRLFRSSGFVDYASSIYLKNLIQAANHRFHQMTHQRLHLELGEGNSFWVRDLLNGGHLRLLKTLSGGQKFQAALSLALALADHIHVRNESQHNFFFLDEGFGSLDKLALQTVFDTLKSLRKENRIVGIISHVEELQQEIQTFLKITDTEEGSRIQESWK
ncbi:AAA family ATPase [Dyadobacter sandarakinus]|uniref:AAA family ATPase n=1 Tax=Dyadobacter sandarakinus TaxID=2747268 RepID=A0ABX7IBL0_9BACT|nr:AAA family ATPase [Dyadobacter sandarakinus]QRR03203.1 AAA family ATPase [Dyadobacter sandarakinus]